MQWRTKAIVQGVFSHLPRGEALNYFCQRHVFKHLPIDDATLVGLATTARRHLSKLEIHGTVPVPEARFSEFGAGRDFVIPLVLWSNDVNHQVVVDIRRLARLALVADTERRLGTAGVGTHRPHPLIIEDAGLAEMLQAFGIDYRAPCDARSTGLPDSSVDVTSTSTLEHIPPTDIRLILREIRRILHPEGVASLFIDYQNHDSYGDSTISVYNFLKFEIGSGGRGARAAFSEPPSPLGLSPPAARGGFRGPGGRPTGGVGRIKTIAGLTLASSFNGRYPEDLTIRTAFLTVRPEV